MRPIDKVKSIISGWKNYTFSLPEIEKLAESRAGICATCDSSVYGTYEKLLKDFRIKEVQGMKCEICGCPLSTKLRSKQEKCPINKW